MLTKQRITRSLSLLAAMLLAYGLYRYPLPPWPLALALLAYGGMLWRWPGVWLVVLPALTPSLDLTPWTGWMVVGEVDFFVLVTVGVLLQRLPPGREDVLPGRNARRLLIALALSLALATVFGLLRPGPAGGTDNPYMSGWETIRLVMPFVTVMALMPFARAYYRSGGDPLIRFGFGMVLGLGLASAIVTVERFAFPGLLDMVTDYRVVGSFSSMHIGGGHVGAYIACSLPFLNVALIHRRAWSLLLLSIVPPLAAYALLVTFARTAYAAAIVGAIVAAYGAPVAAWFLIRDKATRRARLLARTMPLLIGLAVLGGGFATAYMSGRMETIPRDFAARVGNWMAGMSLATPTLLEKTIGLGLGTYPRIAAARLPDLEGPSNYRLRPSPEGPILRLEMKRRLYFGQKVLVEPGTTYTLHLRARGAQSAGFGVLLCEKLLLYTLFCTVDKVTPGRANAWLDYTTTLRAPGVIHTGWLREDLRTIEFSIAVTNGETMEFADLSLKDAAGQDVLANGDFSHGLDRWFFTDDNHLSWRIKDQYLTEIFEVGAIGCAIFLVFSIGAFLGAMRRMGAGDPMAACIAPALAALAMSGVFDAVLEAPHIATIFYFLAMFGLDGLDDRAEEPSRKLQIIPDAVIAAPSNTSVSNLSP